MTVTIDEHIDITIDLTDDQKRFYRWWVSALESGEFKQTTGTLRASLPSDVDRPITSLHVAKHCCLGVAAEGMRLDEFTAIREKLDLHFYINETGGMAANDCPMDDGRCRGSDDLLPDKFTDFLGFCWASGPESLGLESENFTSANDEHNVDFLGIARAIRLALVGEVVPARAILCGNENVVNVDAEGSAYDPEYDHSRDI